MIVKRRMQDREEPFRAGRFRQTGKTRWIILAMIFRAVRLRNKENLSIILLWSTDAENRTEGAVLFLVFFLIFKIF